MKNLKNFKENNENKRVDLFKKRYKEKDYIGAANIVLSGWGTKEPPLTKDENGLIEEFIKTTTKIEQEQYNNAMRSTTGSFG